MAFSKRSLILMPASAACCGRILAAVKPGTVFTSSKCGSPSLKMNSLLLKPDRRNTRYTFSAKIRTLFASISLIRAGVISCDWPKYLAL